ncbi:glycosyltransferase family 4 protein [Merdimonas faecis]|uniref:glycosyltransferase family 4 protein n=1 Tax=Merdimonas faecis TaxID=1653435 RepID=UPI0009F1FEBF|nr:glycosyltransferase family 4 protein [Merdimonas faecis]
MLKILQMSAYCDPEQISSSHLTDDLYDAFSKSNICVEDYVPTPCRGISKEVRSKFKKIPYEEKFNGHYIINRFPMFPEGKNPLLRALRYILVNIIQYFKGIRAKNVDVIFSGSTPPTQGLLCSMVKKKLKVPFVFTLQDVFPDSMVNTGLTSEGALIWKIGRKLESYTYDNADAIIVISEDIKKNIIRKGVPEEKIYVIHNWIDTDKVYPISKGENYLYTKYKISKDMFNVVYAGNLGFAQNIEVILSAAKTLQEKENIQFLIFGKEAQAEEYKKKVLEMELSNVRFLPIQPYSEVSYVYSLGDASIVSCKKGFGGSAMPSKTWCIMATGTPVLASFDSETEMESIIKTVEVGVFSDADDFRGLADNILKLYADESLKEKLGMNARTYVEKNLNRRVCTQKYIDTIMETV